MNIDEKYRTIRSRYWRCWSIRGKASLKIMMTSSNGSIFRVTGHLSEKLTGPRRIPQKGQWRGALMLSLIPVWINGWVNNREAGDLRRYSAHYDVTVMWIISPDGNQLMSMVFCLVISVSLVNSYGRTNNWYYNIPLSFMRKLSAYHMFWQCVHFCNNLLTAC